MLICDAHADTLYAMQDKTRDAALPCDVTLARMTVKPEDTRVQALALWTGLHGLHLGDQGLIGRELAMLDQLKAEGWKQVTRISEAKPGEATLMLTIEGGEALEGGPQVVDAFAEYGVRFAALVWNNVNQLAYPSVGGSAKGLTALGRRVLKHMGERHMAADVSHMNEAGFQEVLALSDVPPIASHTACRALCDHPRCLSDAQLKAMFEHEGFVGVCFYPAFLRAQGEATLDDVAEHLEHMIALGGEKRIGLGSDFDGIERHVAGLSHAGEVYALFERLRERGWSEQSIADVAGENFRRYVDAL